MGKKNKRQKNKNGTSPRHGSATVATLPTSVALPGHRGMDPEFERGMNAYRSFYSNAVAWGTSLLTDARDNYSLDDASAAQLFPISVTAWACATYRAEVESSIGPRVVDSDDVEVDEADNPIKWFSDNYARLVYHASLSRMIWGKVYFLKLRNRAGKPTRLHWLNPLDVSPDIDYTKQEWQGFRIRGIDNLVPPEDVIVDLTFDPLNDFDGVSNFEVAMRQVVGDRELVRFAQRYFQSGTMLGGMLTYEGDPNDEELLMLKQEFEQFKGSQNAWKTFVAGGGISKFDFKPMQPTPVDLAMKDLKDVFRVDTCVAFKVNPVLIGVAYAADALSAQNTYQQVHIAFVLDTALPSTGRTYQILTEQWLTPDFGDWGKLKIIPNRDEIDAASKATTERSVLALGNAGRFWTIDEAREYTGRPILTHPAVQINPDWSNMLWKDGQVRRNHSLRLIGLEPELGQPDGYIYELDPRAKGNPQSQMSISFPPHNTQTSVEYASAEPPAQLPSPKVEENRPRAESVEATEPSIEAEVIRQPPIISDAVITKARLFELDAWRKIVKKRGIDVPFEIRHLTADIADYVRGELLGFWNPVMVFGEAKRAVRVGEQPRLMGATAEDAAAWWRDFDNIQHDIGESWLEYQRKASSVAFDQAEKGDFAPLDAASLSHRDELIAAWIGTPEAPGKLAQVLLAGMAAGDKSLQKEISANPHSARAAIFNIAWNIDAAEAQDFIKSYAFGLIKQLDDQTKDDIRDALIKFTSNAFNIEQLHNAVAAILVAPGMTPNDSIIARAKAIGDTESARAFNQGAVNRWARANVFMARCYTVRDERVCKLCRGLYGTVADVRVGWDIGGGRKAIPPFHTHCRDYMRPDLSAGIQQPLSGVA